jgi:hypothetical protein
MVIVFSLLQHNPHGYTLHNFHVVASRILRRQQAEPRTGRSTQRINVAVVVASGRISADSHRLSRLHPLQLCFFEISRDPKVIHGNDGEQLLAGLHSLACFHRFAADDAAHRRNDLCITQVQLCGSELGAGTCSV